MYLKNFNITTTSNIIHILLCIINIIKMVFIIINIKADDYNNTFHYSLAIARPGVRILCVYTYAMHDM